MNGELDALLQYIVEHYPFSIDKFPKLNDASQEDAFRFALQHLVLHAAKSTGKLATVLERNDHGEELDLHSAKDDTVKSLVTILRLAAMLGMSESDIHGRIIRMYNPETH